VFSFVPQVFNILRFRPPCLRTLQLDHYLLSMHVCHCLILPVILSLFHLITSLLILIALTLHHFKLHVNSTLPTPGLFFTFHPPVHHSMSQSFSPCLPTPFWWYRIEPWPDQFHCLYSQHPFHSYWLSLFCSVWSHRLTIQISSASPKPGSNLPPHLQNSFRAPLMATPSSAFAAEFFSQKSPPKKRGY